MIYRPQQLMILGICQSLCLTASACKLGWTDRGPAWGGDSWGPKKHCIRWESWIPHGFDAAFAKLLWPPLRRCSTNSKSFSPHVVGMFTHFGIKPSSCYFQHMVRGSHLVIYNTARVHTQIMRPWVQCALDAACVSPAGADSGSCVRRRPRYLYSGCHRYAESALNIVLGLAFNFEDSEYMLSNFSVLFGEENSTSTMHSITHSRWTRRC